MKKSMLAILSIAVLSGNVVFAISPSQDKPASQTTTTVKKTMPTAKTSVKTTKTTHQKHVKNS